MLNIQKTNDAGVLTVALGGRLDTTTAPELEAGLKDGLEGVTELIMDFQELEYISSAGLRVLMIAHRVVGEGGKIRVIHAKDVIRTVLEMTGFAEVLTIEDN